MELNTHQVLPATLPHLRVHGPLDFPQLLMAEGVKMGECGASWKIFHCIIKVKKNTLILTHCHKTFCHRKLYFRVVIGGWRDWGGFFCLAGLGCFVVGVGLVFPFFFFFLFFKQQLLEKRTKNQVIKNKTCDLGEEGDWQVCKHMQQNPPQSKNREKHIKK